MTVVQNDEEQLKEKIHTLELEVECLRHEIRLRADEALKESERRLQTLISNLPGLVYRCNNDRNWTMVYLSEGCLPLTGYAPADLIHNARLSYNDLIYPDDAAGVWTQVQQHVQAHQPYQLTYRIRTATGALKWVWEKGCAVYADDGAVLALEGFITDITERKQAEDALRESEEKFRFLFDTMAQGVVLQDAESRIVEANLAASEILGLPMDQLIGKTAYEPRWTLIHEDNSPLNPEEMPSNIALHTGTAVINVVAGVYLPIRNIYHWIIINSVPKFKVGADHPYLTMTTFTDITVWKQAEEGLQKSEEKFRSLFETMTEGVAIHELVRDNNGKPVNYRIMQINPAYSRQTGIPLAQAKGALATELYATETPPYLDVFTTVAETAIPYAFETFFPPLQKYFAISVFSPGPGKFATVFQDITERKQTEEALRASEERFRVLVEQAPEAIAVFDVELNRFVNVNTNAERLFGCNREELLSSSPDQFYLPNQPDGKPIAESMQRHIAAAMAGAEQVFERSVRNAQGRELICEVRLVMLPSIEHKLIRASFIDITERKQTEETLRLTRFSVDRAGDMIFWIDFTGRLLYVNEAGCRRLGYTIDELCRMTVFDIDPFIPRESWPQHSAKLRQLGSFIIETQHRTKSGEIFPVEISINYIAYGGKEYNFAFARDITERKQAEEEREQLYAENKAQRMLFETIVHEVPAGIVLLQGAEHRYVLANPAYASLVSGKGEVVGRTVAEVFPEITAVVIPLLDHVYQTGEPFSTTDMPLMIMREGKSGIAYISFTYTPWRDAQGNIQGVLVLAIETTAQVQAHQEVETERTQLRTVLSALPVGIFILDAEGRIVKTNETANRIWGGNVPRVSNITEYNEFQGWWADTGETIKPEEWAGVRAVMHGETAIGEVITIQRFDNSFGTIFNSAVPLSDADGKITGAVVVIQDITERKQAEDTIIRERAFLASAIELLPFPLFFVSASQVVIRQNTASLAVFQQLDTENWGHIQLRDAQTRALIAQEDWPFIRAMHGEKAPASSEWILVRPDRREMPIFLQVAPIYIGDEFVAIVVAFQDISALKEADRAKNQFLMILSHEMKTPLTSIIGWTQLAQDAPDSVPEALTTILRNAEAQKVVIERLLTLSYILTGKLILRLTPLDLWQHITTVAAEMQAMAQEHRITLLLNEPPTSLYIGADAKYLRQALKEVINNAIQFTEAERQIIVTMQQEDNRVRLCIQDTGCGIAPDKLPRLLAPFHQIDRDETKGGLGIGLALARGIIEALSGRMTIASAGLGQGTTVCFEFPLIPREELPAATAN